MTTAQKPSAFMKAMNMNPKTDKDAWHFEPRKGTEEQAVNYATKEDTRMDGTWFHDYINPYLYNLEELKCLYDTAQTYVCRLAYDKHWGERAREADGSGISSGDDEEYQVIANLGGLTPNDLREVSPRIRGALDGTLQRQQGQGDRSKRVRTLGANRHRKNEEGVRHGYTAPRRTTGNAVLR